MTYPDKVHKVHDQRRSIIVQLRLQQPLQDPITVPVVDLPIPTPGYDDSIVERDQGGITFRRLADCTLVRLSWS
jgi:hypothetical protein